MAKKTTRRRRRRFEPKQPEPDTPPETSEIAENETKPPLSRAKKGRKGVNNNSTLLEAVERYWFIRIKKCIDEESDLSTEEWAIIDGLYKVGALQKAPTASQMDEGPGSLGPEASTGTEEGEGDNEELHPISMADSPFVTRNRDAAAS